MYDSKGYATVSKLCERPRARDGGRLVREMVDGAILFTTVPRAYRRRKRNVAENQSPTRTDFSAKTERTRGRGIVYANDYYYYIYLFPLLLFLLRLLFLFLRETRSVQLGDQFFHYRLTQSYKKYF